MVVRGTSEMAKKLTIGTLDARYDNLKSGRVKPIDGDEAFARLHEKSEQRRCRPGTQRVKLSE